MQGDSKKPPQPKTVFQEQQFTCETDFFRIIDCKEVNLTPQESKIQQAIDAELARQRILIRSCQPGMEIHHDLLIRKLENPVFRALVIIGKRNIPPALQFPTEMPPPPILFDLVRRKKLSLSQVLDILGGPALVREALVQEPVANAILAEKIGLNDVLKITNQSQLASIVATAETIQRESGSAPTHD